MRIVLFTHSLVSDWNHGNAHFLRGVMRELVARGHDVLAFEPEDGWSRSNLIADQGQAALDRFVAHFPELPVKTYGSAFDPADAIADADVVIVHEWTDGALVRRIGEVRRRNPFTLLFHDTHHRAVSDRDAIAGLDLDDYDGVLAFGDTLRTRYLAAGWGRAVFTWHEAADTRLFLPRPADPTADIVWVGNWGDDERTRELDAFLFEPVRSLGLKGTVRGVRYPAEARRKVTAAGLAFGGWIANPDVPELFAAHRFTVHVPRRPYAEALPGIPTIRVFEALACGIPLICAPWLDSEGLFRPGTDYLVARSGDEMTRLMRAVIGDADLRRALAHAGRERIEARHTCAHRVDALFSILATCGTDRVRRAMDAKDAAA
jgi:spore maturation protein CgeB